MGAQGFIAGKIRFKGRLSAVAVAVSFLVIIIAVSVAAGFRREIRAGVSSLSGDILMTRPEADFFGEDKPFADTLSYMEELLDIPGVSGITPVIFRAGIARSGGNIQGIMLKGVPGCDSTLHATVPRRLADALDLGTGDKFLTYFIGEKVKARQFTVARIEDSVLDAEGTIMVKVPLEDLQRLNGWQEHEVSALQIMMDEDARERDDVRMAAFNASVISADRAREDEAILKAVAGADRYGQLFDWLDLIDTNVTAILVLMIIVAGFNMVSGLLILLLRNVGTIGMLKAIGMSDKGIAGVFLRVAARLACLGMLAGNALALLLCAVQDKTHLITLNPENYFVSFVPVSVNLPHILLADAIALAAILLIMLIPSTFISKVDPAETAGR